MRETTVTGMTVEVRLAPLLQALERIVEKCYAGELCEYDAERCESIARAIRIRLQEIEPE